MDAVTYPHPRVAGAVMAETVPVRLPHDHKPLAETFQVKWTPTVVLLDSGGRERKRATGFQAPEEFLPWLTLALAQERFEAEDFPAALARLEELDRAWPDSAAAPEGVFLSGVARFKATGDRASLKRAYETLAGRYPESEWTRRAAPYKLL